jgi:hypothetical protein
VIRVPMEGFHPQDIPTFYHEEQGVGVADVVQRLGHYDLETTMVYLKGSDAADERSQAQMARAYEAFV